MSGIEFLLNYVVALTIALIRFGAFLIVMPVFDKNSITGLARGALAVGFSLILLPLVYPQVQGNWPLAGWTVLAIVLKEAFLGIVIGLLIGMMFWVVSGVGSFFDTQRGTSIGTIFDPMLGEQTSPTGVFLLRWLTVLYFVTGGFTLTLELIYRSYSLWPIVSFFPDIKPVFWIYFGEWIDTFMRLVVVFASPMILMMFLVQIGLGLMNRFSPQLNVFTVSMPVMTGVGLFVLILFIPRLTGLVLEHLDKVLQQVLEFTLIMGGSDAR